MIQCIHFLIDVIGFFLPPVQRRRNVRQLAEFVRLILFYPLRWCTSVAIRSNNQLHKIGFTYHTTAATDPEQLNRLVPQTDRAYKERFRRAYSWVPL